jgi:hypothetical protein
MKKEMKDETYSFMMSISLLLFGVDIFVVEVARERESRYLQSGCSARRDDFRRRAYVHSTSKKTREVKRRGTLRSVRRVVVLERKCHQKM